MQPMSLSGTPLVMSGLSDGGSPLMPTIRVPPFSGAGCAVAPDMASAHAASEISVPITRKLIDERVDCSLEVQLAIPYPSPDIVEISLVALEARTEDVELAPCRLRRGA